MTDVFYPFKKSIPNHLTWNAFLIDALNFMCLKTLKGRYLVIEILTQEWKELRLPAVIFLYSGLVLRSID